MANNKQRYVNTKLWNDNYISELDPIEKLLFVYFITNEHTNISGIYELPLKVIGIETGIDTSMLKKILPRLESKIQYVDGFVVIKNFVKHQEANSENIKKGILNCLKDLDKQWLIDVINRGFYLLPKEYLDTLCIPLITPSNYLDSNLDSNSNLDSSAKIARVSFEEFWELYPKKVNKKKAELKWNSLQPHIQREIIEVLPLQIASAVWQKEGGQFIPHPTTYLNGERWTDEIELPKVREVFKY